MHCDLCEQDVRTLWTLWVSPDPDYVEETGTWIEVCSDCHTIFF